LRPDLAGGAVGSPDGASLPGREHLGRGRRIVAVVQDADADPLASVEVHGVPVDVIRTEAAIRRDALQAAGVGPIVVGFEGVEPTRVR
jgi:hypothetical protein